VAEQEIVGVAPAFANYLGRFRGSFGQDRTGGHFDTYCRGLLTDLPRKTVEPIALEGGTAVRTLREFLVTARWNHDQARDTLQQNLAGVLGRLPADRLLSDGMTPEPFDQMLVNEYLPGQGISSHRDYEPYGRTVVSLSLLSRASWTSAIHRQGARNTCSCCRGAF
jgi:hypothetical protein